MPVRSFRDLEVWRLSMQLAVDVHRFSHTLPSDEKFGLSIQMRRASISIPSNIAEGSGYGLTGRYVHHLRIARGSEAELQTQLEIARDLGFATATQTKPILAKASEVGRMVNGLILSLTANS